MTHSADWHDSVDLAVIADHPDVVAMVEAHSGSRPGGMSADQFFDTARPIMKRLGGGSVDAKLIAKVAQPLSARLGIRTGRQQTLGLRYPPGQVIAAALVSLASRNQPLKHAEQGEDGCILQAELPSSMFTFAGDLVITLQRHEEGTRVTGAVMVRGQAFDWGHLKRVLKALFDDMGSHLHSMQ